MELAFAVAYAVALLLTCWVSRSITWTVAAVGAAVAVTGAFVSFRLQLGMTWSFTSLQWMVMIALGGALIAAVNRRRTGRASAITLRRELLIGVVPMAVVLAFVVASRLIAAPRAGAFTAVGFLVRRTHAEDNAKWLDFTSQLATGGGIVQGVPMGGPLQLFLVVVATVLAAVSMVLLGGLNEVFVSANTVVYGEFLLAAMIPLALTPIALRSGRRRVPLIAVWGGALVLVTGSLAASGLGHMTLQFVMLAAAFWAAAFAYGSSERHLRWLASLTVAAAALVWFPLLPVSLPLLWVGTLVLAVRAVRGRSWIAGLALWSVTAVLTWPEFTSTIRYIADVPQASGAGGSPSGGITAGIRVPSLQLLESQGGTEVAGPLLATMAVVAVVAGAALMRGSRRATLVACLPVVALAAYALLLTVAGTWWAGVGPEYGAQKTTFLVTVVALGVFVPAAVMAITPARSGASAGRIAAVVGVAYLLAVDGVLPRAVLYASPEQWPDAAGDARGFWWPAEVRKVPEQPISASPIGCAYLAPGAQVPSALPNGQTAYSCTRILAGLAGADTTGLPVVNWLRREWLTNEQAWLNEYPGLSTMPADVRARPLILLDEINRVIGIEPVQGYLDRVKPEWAQ